MPLPFTFFWYVLSISGFARLVKPFIKIDTHRPCVSEWRLFGNAASTAWAAAFLLNADMIGAAAGPFEVPATGVVTAHIGHSGGRRVIGCDIADPFAAAIASADSILLTGMVYLHAPQAALAAFVVAAILLGTIQK